MPPKPQYGKPPGPGKQPGPTPSTGPYVVPDKDPAKAPLAPVVLSPTAGPVSDGTPVDDATMAAIDGAADKPQAMATWWATVDSVSGALAMVTLAGDSVSIQVADELGVTADARVAVDFRDNGHAAIVRQV